MDSISQIALGAGVGELVLGKKIGNKALLFGAIAGTIPDLDVFLHFFTHLSESEALLVHRSYSHAAIPQLAIALPFTYLSYKLFKKQISFFRWYLLWYLGFLTHAMLDCCTTYGTQFFLPFSRYLVGLNNISVVDPLYTIPFLILLAILLFYPKESKTRFIIAVLSVVLSTGYIGYATLNKFKANSFFKDALHKENIQFTQFSTSPTLFTSFLWNMIAANDSTIYVSEYSIFQSSQKPIIQAYKRNLHLLDDCKNSEAVKTLLWFSQGKYFVEKGNNDTLDFYNIKWGRTDYTQINPKDAFRFYVKIYKDKNGVYTFDKVEPNFKRRDIKAYLSLIWHCIFDN